MKNAIIQFLFTVLLLANTNLSFAADPNLTIQWQKGPAQGQWQMLTTHPQLNKRIVFAGPTKTFANDCQAQVEIPVAPKIYIIESSKIVKLGFGLPAQGIECPDVNDPVYGYVTVEVGPLSGGNWKFEIASPTQICQYTKNFNVNSFDAGEGTPDDPYQIATKQDLLACGADTFNYDKYYILTADINLAGEVYQKALIAPYQSNVIMPFKGVFDGNGFKITGLTIDGQGTNAVLGLFGIVSTGQIKNLNLENISIIRGTGSIGSLVGSNGGGIISNCSSKNFTIDGNNQSIGGLIGKNDYGYKYPPPISIKGIVTNCYSSGQVNGYDDAGGLVGYNGCDIIDCDSNCTVNGRTIVGGLVGYNMGDIIDCNSNCTLKGSGSVGGLVGQNKRQPGDPKYKAYIFNCTSSGQVTANSYASSIGGLVGTNYGDIANSNSNASVSGSGCVGGLVGTNSYQSKIVGSISKSHASGNITGNYKIGGLVGYNQKANILDCYSIGSVSGNSTVGGLAGCNLGRIFNCYSAGDVSGNEYVGGLIGDVYDACDVSLNELINCFWNLQTQSHGVSQTVGHSNGTNIEGLTTAQMQKKITYTADPNGWDFENIWDMGENQTYPYLRQYLACDLNQDQKTDYVDLAVLAQNWLLSVE